MATSHELCQALLWDPGAGKHLSREEGSVSLSLKVSLNHTACIYAGGFAECYFFCTGVYIRLFSQMNLIYWQLGRAASQKASSASSVSLMGSLSAGCLSSVSLVSWIEQSHGRKTVGEQSSTVPWRWSQWLNREGLLCWIGSSTAKAWSTSLRAPSLISSLCFPFLYCPRDVRAIYHISVWTVLNIN